MTEEPASLQALDAAYQPFPAFEAWLARTSVDETRWTRYLEAISLLRRDLDPDAQRRAYEIVRRAAAMDTGAIEGLYEVDRGFTFTVAMEGARWESALAEKGERVRPLFEAQLRGYEYILSLATKAEPFSEAAIRALHAEVCSAQETYRVITPVGWQEHPLPKGVYKAFPNHVRTRKGTDHSYAPKDATPMEMARLVQALRSEPFLAAHPIIQAAYAHYGLVVIHPFADGNGRVARALASAFTYRSISMPIVILSEHGQMYLDSLEAADRGQYQVFVDFMLDRSLETIKLVEENLRLALSPSAEETFAAIQRLYITRGGYTQEQVDAASVPLIDQLTREVQRALARFQGPRLAVQVGIKQMPYAPSRESYRMPLQGGRGVEIHMSTPPPANASTQREYWVEVPKDAAGADDIVIRDATHDAFTAKLDELMPGPSGMLQTRISLFAERIVGEMLAWLSEQAEKKLRESDR
jgi:Fic family protein